jgi:phosphoacetylglucosamine mutase
LENEFAAKKLMALLHISNRLVGDAIANLFVIEAILYDLDMSIEQFDSIYTESPSRMYKIKVADRNKFKVTEDESRLTFPTELQDDIDKAIKNVTNGKAFVRASGTEDVIRLYCEAETQE